MTLDGLRAVLPDLDELRPLVDRLTAGSEADPARAWAGSGELGTIGDRLIAPDALIGETSELARRECAHLERIYELNARAIAALAEGDVETAAETFLEAAAEEQSRDRADRAEAYADSAYRVARDGGGVELASRALRRRARHRRAQGRYEESRRDYDEAALAADSGNDARGVAEALIGAGNVEEEQGHWPQAAELYRQALARIEDLSEVVPEAWHAHLNLHVVLRSIGELEAAEEPLEEARRIAAQLEDPSARAFLENARGQFLMATADFVSAERHLRSALEASESAVAEITIRLNLAEALLATGRTLDAAQEARRAERHALVAGLPKKLPEVYRLLGRIAALENIADAFVLFERALQLIEQRGLPVLERAQTLQAYAEAERRVGDPDAARDLLAEADRLYAQLGIERRRDPWADRFDHETGMTRDDDEGNTDE